MAACVPVLCLRGGSCVKNGDEEGCVGRIAEYAKDAAFLGVALGAIALWGYQSQPEAGAESLDYHASRRQSEQRWETPTPPPPPGFAAYFMTAAEANVWMASLSQQPRTCWIHTPGFAICFPGYTIDNKPPGWRELMQRRNDEDDV